MGRKKKTEVQTLATVGTMNVRLKNEDNVQLLPQTDSEIVTHGDSTVKSVLDGKQDKLTEGTGIKIDGTTISCTVDLSSIDLSGYLTKSDAADTYATQSALDALQTAIDTLQTTVNKLDDLYLRLTGGTLTGTLNIGNTKIEVGDNGITLPNGIIFT